MSELRSIADAIEDAGWHIGALKVRAVEIDNACFCSALIKISNLDFNPHQPSIDVIKEIAAFALATLGTAEARLGEPNGK